MYKMKTPFLAVLFIAVAITPVYSQDTSSTSNEGIEEVEMSFSDHSNQVIGEANKWLGKVLFFDVSFGIFDKSTTDRETGQIVEGETVKMPFVVIFLAFGAIFFTFQHRFINIRGFRHAIEIVRGKYVKADDHGDLTPFRALTSALSATVGLGNIANVAIAMTIGGPGALFWMMVLGFFGMAAKFHESTLAQMYRIKNDDGTISGGPMYYLSKGIAETVPSLAWLGKLLAVIFSISCIMGAIGAGNMFQANQAFEGFFYTFVEPSVTGDIGNLKETISYGFGLTMSALVAVVVLGGITRIGAATSRIVPFMAILYITLCSIIIISHIEKLPDIISLVFTEAFNTQSAFGGIIGAMMLGFRRAAFSSEAGLGSSAIAHSAAKTNEPVREGLVASLEPFIDTIIICFMTGIVVLITGAYCTEGVEGGSAITIYAFKQIDHFGSVFPYLLTICIILFAFSTMLSWCYYGERAWGYLFGVNKKVAGIRSIVIFRLIFVIFIFFGCISKLTIILDFADLMLLSMALPNIIGGIILAPRVKRELEKYWYKYKQDKLAAHR